MLCEYIKELTRNHYSGGKTKKKKKLLKFRNRNILNKCVLSSSLKGNLPYSHSNETFFVSNTY